MEKLFELKQARAKLIHDQREIVDRAGIVDGELRALSAEDKSALDKMASEVDTFDDLIERITALTEADAEGQAEEDRDEAKADTDEDMEDRSRRSRSSRKGRHVPFNSTPSHDVTGTKGYRSAYKTWIRNGYMDAQYRDVIASTNSAGGFLATPVEVSKEIIQIINNMVFMRKRATVTKVNSAQSLGVRQVLTQPSDAQWTTELVTSPNDTAMSFGQRALTPNLLTKAIAVSLREMQLVPDVEELVTERIGYKFSVAEENAFLNGTGSGQPLGVFTASANGIPTSQDVVCSASGSTAITADSLISAKYQIKQPYLQGDGVSWLFNRTTIGQIRLLKDSYGRYLWADGGGFASAPDTILGIPVDISEYVPNTYTASSYVGALGNWSYYRIAEMDIVELQRLVELYAPQNEVGFLGRRYVDGAMTLGEAAVRLQLHS